MLEGKVVVQKINCLGNLVILGMIDMLHNKVRFEIIQDIKTHSTQKGDCTGSHLRFSKITYPPN